MQRIGSDSLRRMATVTVGCGTLLFLRRRPGNRHRQQVGPRRWGRKRPVPRDVDAVAGWGTTRQPPCRQVPTGWSAHG